MKKIIKTLVVLILLFVLVTSTALANQIVDSDFSQAAAKLDELIELMRENPDGIKNYDLSSAYQYGSVSYNDFKNGMEAEAKYVYVPILSNSDERGAAHVKYDVDGAEIMYYDLGMETGSLMPTKENLTLILGEDVSKYSVMKINDLSTVVVSYIDASGEEYVIPFDSTGTYSFSMRTKYTKNDFVSLVESQVSNAAYVDGLYYGSDPVNEQRMDCWWMLIGVILVALVINERYSSKKHASK